MKNAVVWSEIAVADLKRAAEPGIDAALERAREAGAKILMPKTALPGNQGYVAHVQDCEGNRVGLHAMS